MKALRLFCGLAALLFCFAFSGCGGGGDEPVMTTNATELEKFLAENPDAEMGVDDDADAEDE